MVAPSSCDFTDHTISACGSHQFHLQRTAIDSRENDSLVLLKDDPINRYWPMIADLRKSHSADEFCLPMTRGEVSHEVSSWAQDTLYKFYKVYSTYIKMCYIYGFLMVRWIFTCNDSYKRGHEVTNAPQYRFSISQRLVATILYCPRCHCIHVDQYTGIVDQISLQSWFKD